MTLRSGSCDCREGKRGVALLRVHVRSTWPSLHLTFHHIALAENSDTMKIPYQQIFAAGLLGSLKHKKGDEISSGQSNREQQSVFTLTVLYRSNPRLLPREVCR